MDRLYDLQPRPTRRSLLAGAGALALATGLGVNMGGAFAQQRGGKITVADLGDETPRFLLSQRATTDSWRYLVFDTLTRIEAGSTEPMPMLATAWTFSDDLKTIELTLRDDVKYHSGRPFTADDVVFVLEQVKDPANASQVRFIAEAFTTIEATSPTTVRIVSAAPLANIFDLFQMTPMADKETWAGLADGSQVVGTGPFIWKNWRPGAVAELVRNEDYWQPDLPLVDAVDLAVFADSTAASVALRSRRAQYCGLLSPTDASAIAASPDFDSFDAGGILYWFGMNVTMAPFDNKLVRQAIGYAIDRQRILQQALNNVGAATDLYWRPVEPGYDEAKASHYTFDPDKARAMLEEAGVVGAEVPITTLALPVTVAVAEIVRNNLEQVGLKASVVRLEIADWDSRVLAGQGDVGGAFVGIHGSADFSAATQISQFYSLRMGNPSKYWSDEYDALRQQLASATTSEQTAAAVGALSDLMLDEAWIQPIARALSTRVTSVRLKDMKYTVTGAPVMTQAYLEG